MMLPDPIKALSEILRVLKPNGLSVNITPSSMDFYSFLDDAKSTILKARGLDPEKNKEYEWSFYNNRAIVQWGRTDAVKKHFSGAGFEEDKLKADMVEVKVNIDDWKLTISVSVRMKCFIFRSRALKLTFFVTLCVFHFLRVSKLTQEWPTFGTISLLPKGIPFGDCSTKASKRSMDLMGNAR